MIVTEKETAATNIEGVFAGGDVTGEVATVVQAMAAGIRAAVAIDAYLTGSKSDSVPTSVGKVPLMINGTALATSSRVVTPQQPVSQRTLRGEDNQTLASQAMEGETLRCANCGCVAVNASDLAPALIALDAQVKTTRRTLAAGDLFAAAESKTTVLADDELIEEIWIPAPQPESRQCYLKFRIRNAIDFPIVSVAFCATLRDGRFHDARVVLGAVAPVPLRFRAVEELLENQAPGKMLANEAASLAVSNSQPLARNKAKVEIVKALVAKAIQTGCW
jgi:CO/xanthine dehydrogenase FAD-binding subunit